MSKNGFNYYDSFAKQAAYAEEVVLNLASAIEKRELGSESLVRALHSVENDADSINHDIQAHLLNDFVVPMERGGMNALAHALDDVIDAVEEIASEAYIYNCTDMPEGGVVMVSYLTEAVVNLRIATDTLRDFSSKRDYIKEFCIKVQSFESEGDILYIESAHNLHVTPMDEAKRRRDHAVLFAIEKALDAAENAAERVEAIVAENA